jgi:hypothetical protein
MIAKNTAPSVANRSMRRTAFVPLSPDFDTDLSHNHPVQKASRRRGTDGWQVSGIIFVVVEEVLDEFRAKCRESAQ